MITMIALGLTLDTATNTPILVLQEKNNSHPQRFGVDSAAQTRSSGADDSGKRVLPVWLGGAEAMTLSLALNEIQPLRPLPHELLQGILELAQGQIVGVSIDDLRDGVFYATLAIEQSGQVYHLDCRPSDGVALAVRKGLDIQVAESVLQKSAEARANPGTSEEKRHPCDMMERIVLESGRAALSELTGGGPFAATPAYQRPLVEPQPAQVSRNFPRTPVKPISAGQDINADDPGLADLLRRLEPATKRMM